MMWGEIAFVYAIGAVLMGIVVSTMKTVTATFHGRRLPFPRLVFGVVGGIIWPFLIWQLLVPRSRDPQ